MSQPNEPLKVRPIRVAPGVRDALIRYEESRPDSRMARDHVDGECDCDVTCTVVGCNPTCACYPRDRAARAFVHCAGTCESQCDDCHSLTHCVPAVTRVGDLLLCASCASERRCIHPGLFSMHVPGDPVRFNPTEHCWQCDRDIPASEL